MKTRLLSMLLSLCMALTMFPAGAFAAQPEQEQLYAQMLELGLVDGDGALIEDNSFTVEDGTRLSSLDELTDWLNQCTADELDTVITVDATGRTATAEQLMYAAVHRVPDDRTCADAQQARIIGQRFSDFGRGRGRRRAVGGHECA